MSDVTGNPGEEPDPEDEPSADLSESTSFLPSRPGRAGDVPDAKGHDDEEEGLKTVDYVRRAQAGNRQALNELFARYVQITKRIVRIKAGRLVLSRNEIDDLVQDSLLDAFRSFDRFEIRHDSSFRAWIHQVVVRSVLTAVERLTTQKNDVRKERPLDAPPGDEDDPRPQLAGDITLPLDRLRRDELRRIVDEEIARFPEPEQTLLIYKLFVYGDAGGRPPWNEIGPGLDLSADAARMRCRRALQSLSQRLKDRGFEPPGSSRG